MNKWIALTLFYVAIGVSVSQASEPWVRIAWRAPIFALWILGSIVAIHLAWKRRHLPKEELQAITTLHQIFPKSWRDWMEGEGKHQSTWLDR